MTTKTAVAVVVPRWYKRQHDAIPQVYDGIVPVVRWDENLPERYYYDY